MRLGALGFGIGVGSDRFGGYGWGESFKRNVIGSAVVTGGALLTGGACTLAGVSAGTLLGACVAAGGVSGSLINKYAVQGGSSPR